MFTPKSHYHYFADKFWFTTSLVVKLKSIAQWEIRFNIKQSLKKHQTKNKKTNKKKHKRLESILTKSCGGDNVCASSFPREATLPKFNVFYLINVLGILVVWDCSYSLLFPIIRAPTTPIGCPEVTSNWTRMK